MGSYTIFLALIVLVAFLLILVIMVQNPKGGGLSSSFGAGSQQLGGFQKTTDFLDKATWTLASALLVLLLLSNFTIDNGSSVSESKALNTDEVTTPVQETPVDDTDAILNDNNSEK
jgi:preprotein translocase subunit SecG